VAEDGQKVEEARLRLARVGMEHVLGYLADGIASWSREGLPVRGVTRISVQDLNTLLSEQPGGIQVLDVRRPVEWNAGHIPNSLLKPLDRLSSLVGDLDRASPLAVHCKSGHRSSIAARRLHAGDGSRRRIRCLANLQPRLHPRR
jgi:hydroxyacylglutathione hydrolase